MRTGMRMKRTRLGVVLGLIVALAAAVRFPALDSEPFWLDEMFSVWFSRQPLQELWAVVPRYETHPPLFYTVLKAWALAWNSWDEASLRAGIPVDRRLVMIYQPHRYSRTRDLYEDFVQVLGDTNVLLLMEVYPAGEEPVPGADSKHLCRSIRLRGQIDPLYVERDADLMPLLRAVLQPGDILLTQGAGDIGGLAPQLAQALTQLGNERKGDKA